MPLSFDLPPLKAHQHVHYCAHCPDHYVCSQPIDMCPVPDPWICLGCELDQQDAYLNRKLAEASRANHR